MDKNKSYAGHHDQDDDPQTIADHAVKKVFAILGVDIDKPESVEEFREDLRFGRRLRKLADHGMLASDARRHRNALMAQCDWTQLPDAPLDAENRTAWATYRQALRDISKQADFPVAIDWPKV